MRVEMNHRMFWLLLLSLNSSQKVNSLIIEKANIVIPSS